MIEVSYNRGEPIANKFESKLKCQLYAKLRNTLVMQYKTHLQDQNTRYVYPHVLESDSIAINWVGIDKFLTKKPQCYYTNW